jgi:putative spermidine/putrescine transport system substrate-binding protein
MKPNTKFAAFTVAGLVWLTACGSSKAATTAQSTSAPTTAAAPGATTGTTGATPAATAASAAATTAAPASATSAAPPTEVVPKFDIPKVPMLDKLGAGEGALDIVVWAGYAEDGTNDPKTDWVHPFEKQTGCTVNAKTADTSDDMVSLIQSGGYDGLSASGDASLRLIVGGDVAPVNTALVPSYANIFDFLKNRSWNSANGTMYGIPHGWGANVLMYNKDVVKPAPDSWGAVFDPASPYKGKITAYDSPIYIADAALYLSKTKPELKITNPYALDKDQFDASIALLKAQKPLIGEYWSSYAKYQQAVTSGSLVLGTSWQVIQNALTAQTPPVNVESVIPKEGSTGWSDTWMIATKAKHPNCMYKWMDWIASGPINQQVANYFGEAPASKDACAGDTGKILCATFHADDKAYSDTIRYWTTPTNTCADGRPVICIAYPDWVKAWDAIKA